jgi:predicted O-methyltransferase YrrM
MWYAIKTYINFLLKSTNQHGVHSPFVYDLVTQCFYDKTPYKAHTEIVSYRQNLLRNDSVISVTDLGSGSKTHKSNERRVADIAKGSGTSIKRAKLLYRLVSYFESTHILELGTSLGIATQAMHLGNPQAEISSVEGCPNCAALAMQQLQAYKNIRVLTGDFSTYIPDFQSETFDLVFFDGHHDKEATLAYFESLLSTVSNTSVFIFDDIYWSKGMTEAWEIIKEHPKVTVTIDTYFWGLVFFRTEQVKEHFRIRV